MPVRENQYWTNLIIYRYVSAVFPHQARALVAAPAETAVRSPLLAGAVVIAVPLVVMFLVAQRHLVEGVARTGSKG